MLNVPRGSLIETRYLSATNYRGSRIKATIDRFGEKLSLTMGYNHSLDSEGNHVVAAGMLADKIDREWGYTVKAKAIISCPAGFGVVVGSCPSAAEGEIFSEKSARAAYERS